MAGTILENLSAKKLTILVSALLVCQLVCFLIGGLIAPVPSSVENILATVCNDRPGAHNDTSVWMYSRGDGSCQSIELNDTPDDPAAPPVSAMDDVRLANKIVFVFQMPLPRDSVIRDYSRWQQNIIGVLQPNIAYHSSYVVQPHTELTIDARLAYRNRGDADADWKYYTSALERRHLDCTVDNHIDDYMYNCDTIPLFELGSLHHDYYLLNVRLPVDTERNMNLNIGNIKDLHLAVIYQNGGFTKVWLGLKTAFFPCIICIMCWFWRRVHQLQRSPVLIEYMLIYLGAALTLLNAPLEFFTLAFDMPYMLLLSDIRQGVFYATLLSFWLIFAGEHMLIQDTAERPTVRSYWRHLSAVGSGCVSLFLFDVCERGGQLRNPFYSIWITHWGTNVAILFIVLAAVSAGCYFLFLCFMVWRVFRNIGAKRTALPTMSAARRLHYEGIIYRFKFLMLATLVCAAMTVIGFVMGQMAEGQWRWNDNIELEFTSAFFTGVYGMWNIYIFALIILYAPSHKQWATESSNENIVSEEIEFNNLPSDQNASEISSLTSFARKAAYD